MIDGKTFFGQPIRNDLITYENIRKVATGQEDDYTTVFRLDYNYFENYYKIIATYIRKQDALNADPIAIQKISFTANLDSAEQTAMYFFIEEIE